MAIAGAPAGNLFPMQSALAQDDPLALADGSNIEYAAVEFLGDAELPPAVGQPDFAVYIAESGHTLSDVFLDYWRATGREAMFGMPISEPFAAPDCYYSQVFERGVLQYLPLKVWTVEPFVRPMPVGRLLIAERTNGLGPHAGGKRLASGNRSPAMRSLAAVHSWIGTPVTKGTTTSARPCPRSSSKMACPRNGSTAGC
jgi:hypothetical protein